MALTREMLRIRADWTKRLSHPRCRIYNVGFVDWRRFCAIVFVLVVVLAPVVGEPVLTVVTILLQAFRLPDNVVHLHVTAYVCL
jgi:hypothetical protein